MATVKQGTLTRAGEWWKHLRPYGKRQFWKKERKAAQNSAMSMQLDGCANSRSPRRASL